MFGRRGKKTLALLLTVLMLLSLIPVAAFAATMTIDSFERKTTCSTKTFQEPFPDFVVIATTGSIGSFHIVWTNTAEPLSAEEQAAFITAFNAAPIPGPFTISSSAVVFENGEFEETYGDHWVSMSEDAGVYTLDFSGSSVWSQFVYGTYSIHETAYYHVTYDWGTPAPSTETEPTDSNDYEAGDPVTVDTMYYMGMTVAADGGTYTFSGWDSSELVEGAMPEDDVTILGSWTFEADPTPVYYTVTYLPGSHGTFAAQTTGELSLGDDTPAAPTVTGESGYTFNGWSPAVADTVSGNATYTAQWTRNSTPSTTYYSVKYTFSGSAPDGASLPATKSYESGELVSIAGGYGDIITEDGTWTFDGWDITDDFEIHSNTVITGSWTFTEDMTEEETPLAPLPEIPEEPEVIEEEEAPLGNLPQTGSVAEPVSPIWTIGMLTLSLSMAAAGLTITFARKKDEENK